MSTSTLTKKAVSFSKYVTILEVYNKTNKRYGGRHQIINFKGKFVDYIYREKFYIKYKWQKFKHNIFKVHKTDKVKTEDDTKPMKQSGKTVATFGVDNRTKTIDLNRFFEDFFENSLLETDMDENSITVVRECYSVPLTDFNTIASSCSSLQEDHITKNTASVVNHSEKIKIQPKLYKSCDSLRSSTNSIDNNLLLKYLISKAQYPIQLKIATSIVKLDLPLWYQSSLIV